MKTCRMTIVIVCLLALCVAAQAGYPMKVRDARGKVITIKAKPMRIVSITPSNTEILFAIGVGPRIVGVTDYCDYPKEARSKKKVGDMSISTEAVLALKPDLVIAHAFMNDSVIPRLESLGLTVFAVDPKSFDQVADDIRTLGKITARPKTAESVAKKMENAIAAVKTSRAKQKPVKALVVIQANPLWAAGPKTFVDEMVKTANAENVAFDARPGFVTFSKELAVSRNPDVIIVGSESDQQYFLTSPVWKTTSAARNKRVYVVNNDLLVRAGPRLAEGLDKLAGLLGR